MIVEVGDPYRPYMVAGVCIRPSIEGICGRPIEWGGHRPHYGSGSPERHAFQAGAAVTMEPRALDAGTLCLVVEIHERVVKLMGLGEAPPSVGDEQLSILDQIERRGRE